MNNNGAGINERKAGLGCELFSLALEALFAVARCDAEKPYSQVGNPRYFHGVRRTVGPLRSWVGKYLGLGFCLNYDLQ